MPGQIIGAYNLRQRMYMCCDGLGRHSQPYKQRWQWCRSDDAPQAQPSILREAICQPAYRYILLPPWESSGIFMRIKMVCKAYDIKNLHTFSAQLHPICDNWIPGPSWRCRGQSRVGNARRRYARCGQQACAVFIYLSSTATECAV